MPAFRTVPFCGTPRARSWLLILAVLAVLLSSATNAGRGQPGSLNVGAQRLSSANTEIDNWLTYGRTYDEQRYSPLTQINAGNVAHLGLAWSFDLESSRGLEATPLVVDGVIYTTGAWSVVYAIDARTGRQLWRFDPEADRARGVHGCCDAVNRGLALWQGKLFVGVFDGRLVAINARSGRKVWDVNTVDSSKPYTITGAPRVVKGKVIIGNGGGEFGTRGYVSAYDAATGRLAWRFYTVPGDPAKPFEHPELAAAAKTWTGEWWKFGGGGNVWDSMAYDPELNLLYVGTGNGSPWPREIRSPQGGDNLYLSSILALNPDTGRLAWHFQTTPGDQWDYTATQHIILATLKFGGIDRKVLMQAPKNGFFYVLDRRTGAFISGKPYVPVTWASGLDPHSGRPVELPSAQYSRTKLALVWPSALGGHNWQPMSYSAQTGLVYIPANDMPFPYQVQPEAYAVDPRGDYNNGITQMRNATRFPAGLAKGALIAWDPVAQREVWRVNQGDAGNGGVLTTAGNLVFQGTTDGYLRAYDAQSGKQLWQIATQTSVIAPPISFRIDGVQYIAVNVRSGGIWGLANAEAQQKYGFDQRVPGRLLVFKLAGKRQLPTVPQREEADFPPTVVAPAARQIVEHGETLYATYCSRCHGPGGVGNTVLPDLRRSPMVRDAALNAILLDGSLVAAGMPSFKGALSPDDVDAIRRYLVQKASEQTNGSEKSASEVRIP